MVGNGAGHFLCSAANCAAMRDRGMFIRCRVLRLLGAIQPNPIPGARWGKTRQGPAGSRYAKTTACAICCKICSDDLYPAKPGPTTAPRSSDCILAPCEKRPARAPRGAPVFSTGKRCSSGRSAEGRAVCWSIDVDAAERLKVGLLACARRETRTDQSRSDSDADVALSRKLTRVCDCYDWHSSVHGHWLLMRLLRTFPDASFAKARARCFEEQFNG